MQVPRWLALQVASVGLLAVLVLSGRVAAGIGFTLSQNTSTAITDGNSMACLAGAATDDNTYYRSFSFADYGISADFRVSRVDFGIERASSSGNSQPLTLAIHAGASQSPGNMLGPLGPVVATDTFDIGDQTLSLVAHPIDGLVPFSAGGLVVSLFSPASGNTFLIGSNSAGESALGYILAPGCGIDQPTAFPVFGEDVDIVLSVTGEVVPEPARWALLLVGSGTLLGVGRLSERLRPNSLGRRPLGQAVLSGPKPGAHSKHCTSIMKGSR